MALMTEALWVLSQHHSLLAKLYPCTYYSRKLTHVETHSNELLSINAALEEWRHAERACCSFYIITDYKTLNI